jgi:hypothetical protein
MDGAFFLKSEKGNQKAENSARRQPPVGSMGMGQGVVLNQKTEIGK